MTVWRENPNARLVEHDGSWWHEDPSNPSWMFLGFAPSPQGTWATFRYHVLHGLLMSYPLRSVVRFAASAALSPNAPDPTPEVSPMPDPTTPDDMELPEMPPQSKRRPWCCPEHRCTPIHQIGERAPWIDRAITSGSSFLCFGRMESPVEFVYDGVRHTNDLRSCSYTPLKGVVANQENADDWRSLAVAYTSALAALSPPEAPNE
jgi:hypothetical protein